MATSEPVVISYLKLPPEEQPFFRLKEIFEVIRDKLEQSTFALAEAQNFKKPELFPPEIKSLMRSLREFASTQCLNVIEVIRTMHEFSGTIMQFLDALPITTSDPTPKIIEIARYASRTSAARWEEAEKEMKEFSDEVITTLEKLRVVLDKDSPNSRNQTTNNLIYIFLTHAFNNHLKSFFTRSTEGSRQLVWAAVGVPQKSNEDDLRGAYVGIAQVDEPTDFVLGVEGKKKEELWVSLDAMFEGISVSRTLSG
ncbi:hypothetical protein AN958_09347 [Leucoagaricus sp. SymC.cos]|nr:hypothetical protein AN958_09347 [Leucoagaricus sp. SymC.cos]